jgi:SAM-dependent methyltransferase
VKDYEPVMSFGEDVAAAYDDAQRFSSTPSREHRDAAVAFLAGLAGEGPALALAIGTGWIALPLAARGISIDGIDISPAMVEQLRAKPGGDRIAVTIGDFADVPVSGSYRLIYVVANTLFNLLTQEDQVRCFENVAAHLTGDGSFVIEAFRPDFLYRLRDHQYVDAEAVEVDEVRLDVARHDPVTQLLDESHVVLSPDGIRLNPIVTRYAWPSEMDLMARIAGLRLRERCAGWNREPVTATSTHLISVYGR